ncbi:MAG: bifunctional nuclease family protein [Anaerolineae bacterium]|nr:bifunctional nuclease family protein [Anaerolineae bacterium]
MEHEFIRLIIESVRLGKNTRQRASVFQEINGDRCLAITMGRYDAEALVIAAKCNQGVYSTWHHILWLFWGILWVIGARHRYLKIRNIVNWRYRIPIVFGATIYDVIITDIIDDVYQSELSLVNHKKEKRSIKIRPSDALCLGVRYNVAIYASREVMEEYSFRLDSIEAAQDENPEKPIFPKTEKK